MIENTIEYVIPKSIPFTKTIRAIDSASSGEIYLRHSDLHEQ